MGQASVIVVGNEKGGAGKSTLAIHIVTALLHGGAKVAVLDLDLRQQTMGHFFANRAAWLAANGATAPMPIEHAISSAGDALAKAPDTEQLARFQAAFNDVAGQSDFVLIDTPGADTAIMRAAHSWTSTNTQPLEIPPSRGISLSRPITSTPLTRDHAITRDLPLSALYKHTPTRDPAIPRAKLLPWGKPRCVACGVIRTLSRCLSPVTAIEAH